jgi:threonine dehydrogenase-like Zn-dependent dehydrogenase
MVLVYHGPRNVQIDDKPMPKIQHPEDAILRVTSTAICGSDLHLYHGTVQESGKQPEKAVETKEKTSSGLSSVTNTINGKRDGWSR